MDCMNEALQSTELRLPAPAEFALLQATALGGGEVRIFRGTENDLVIANFDTLWKLLKTYDL